MKYKGMNENTIRRMLQSNETALLQKGVTDMLNTITNTTDSLLSSFSIEKFFSNKNFSDLSAFVKDILKQVENIANKAANVKIDSNLSMEKQIDDFMKEMKVSESNKLSNLDKTVIDFAKSLENKDEMEESNTAIFRKMILDSLDFFKQQFIDIGNRISSLYSSDSLISSISENLNKLSVNDDNSSKTTDYTEEQKKDEEKLRSERHINIAEKQISWLEGTLMPWLKEFGAESLSSDGFLATFFPMLATMINASPLLLKLIGFAKMFLGIGGAIFGIWKFVEGINQAVDVLGHEIDFTKLDGWIQALNLGLGNIVSAITGIDLKTVYNWLNNFDKTLEHAYQRYLEPIVGSLWNSVKKLLSPFITKIQESFNSVINDFVKKYPGLAEIAESIYKYFSETIVPFFKENYKQIFESIVETLKDVTNFTKKGFNIMVNPLGLGKDFELSFDSLVEAVVNISTTVETIWNLVTKVVTDLTNLKWYEMTPTGIMSALAKSMYEGVSQGIENFGELKEHKLTYIKEGSEGVEKRELEKEKEIIKQQRQTLFTLNKMYENVSLKSNWLGGIDYEGMASNISQGWEESLKEGGLSDEESRKISNVMKMTLADDLKNIYQESKDKNEDFITNVNDYLKRTTNVYTESLINDRNQSIQSIENKIEEYQNIINKRKGIQPVKSSNQIENNIMSANNQAEIRAEETKPVQPNIDASGSGNVITTNNYNTTNTNGSNNNGLDQLKSAPQNM